MIHIYWATIQEYPIYGDDVFVNQGVNVADMGVAVPLISGRAVADVSELVGTRSTELRVGIVAGADSVAKGREMVVCVAGSKDGVGVDVEIGRLNIQK